MLVWFRVLSFLRLFKKTRALIRLILEVCKDMYAFTMVLIIAIIAFSITYDITVTTGDEVPNPFFGSLNHIFLLMYGDFSYDDYGPA